MDGLRQYVISVVSAALICSILSGLTQKGAAKELVRLLCGLFLTITVLHPIGQIDFSDLIAYSMSYALEAEYAADTGAEMARAAMADIIKAESEAYILDKAAEVNADLTVNITVSEERIPVRAVLCGEISPYARQRLEDILESDLGITKENQVWTG